jgi:hypothetical protein
MPGHCSAGTAGAFPVATAGFHKPFFMQLGQRMIHILTTQTVSGALYEVDMRLRPNGNSEMLVTAIGAFEKYQRDNAWTWEHQALARARSVAGDRAMADRFDAIRRQVLCRAGAGGVAGEVLEMREKMRAHLGSKGGAGQFNIKHDAGGIVDIEFIVQYLPLAHACRHPALVEYTDNMRMLDAIRATACWSRTPWISCRRPIFSFSSAVWCTAGCCRTKPTPSIPTVTPGLRRRATANGCGGLGRGFLRRAESSGVAQILPQPPCLGIAAGSAKKRRPPGGCPCHGL